MQIQEQLNLHFCPIIDNIINNYSSLPLSDKKANLIVNECQNLMNTVAENSKALFETTDLDRSILCHSLNRLIVHLKIKPFNFICVTAKIDKLHKAIQACESIKIKHRKRENLFNVLPIDIQRIIITTIPYDSSTHLQIKSLYDLFEPLFYNNIMPFIIDNNIASIDFLLNSCKFSSLELTETAPFLNTVKIHNREFKRYKINIKELSNATSLKIEYGNLYYPEKYVSSVFCDVSSLAKLKKLELLGYPTTIDHTVSNLMNLHTLSLNIIADSGLENLLCLTNLENLKLDHDGRIDGLHLNSIGSLVKRMTNLKNLYLKLQNYRTLEIDQFWTLKRVDHLENLNIYFGCITASNRTGEFFKKLHASFSSESQTTKISLTNFEDYQKYIKSTTRCHYKYGVPIPAYLSLETFEGLVKFTNTPSK